MATIGDFDPLNSTVPATKIELTVSCRNLLDMDTFSKSDPVVVLYVQGIGTKEWREFGRTEVIDNTLNPDFVRKFVLDFFFEEKQNLRFDVQLPFRCEGSSQSKPGVEGVAGCWGDVTVPTSLLPQRRGDRCPLQGARGEEESKSRIPSRGPEERKSRGPSMWQVVVARAEPPPQICHID